MSIIRFARYSMVFLAVVMEFAALYALFVLGDERTMILFGAFLVIGILGAVAAWIVEELDV